MTDIIIPDGMDTEGLAEFSIISWLYPDGATVKQGDVVCEVMAEKTNVEIDAPVSGTLQIVKVADEIVTVNEIIGRITE